MTDFDLDQEALSPDYINGAEERHWESYTTEFPEVSDALTGIVDEYGIGITGATAAFDLEENRELNGEEASKLLYGELEAADFVSNTEEVTMLHLFTDMGTFTWYDQNGVITAGFLGDAHSNEGPVTDYVRATSDILE